MEAFKHNQATVQHSKFSFYTHSVTRIQSSKSLSIHQFCHPSQLLGQNHESQRHFHQRERTRAQPGCTEPLTITLFWVTFWASKGQKGTHLPPPPSCSCFTFSAISPANQRIETDRHASATRDPLGPFDSGPRQMIAEY